MVKQHTAKEQVTNELAALQKRISELEAAEAEHKRAEEALRHLEHRYRTALDKARDGIVITDADRMIVDANPAFLAALGCDSKEQVIGTPLVDCLAPSTRRKLDAGMRDTITKTLREGKGYVVNVEMLALNRHGRKFPVEINFSQLRDESGQPAGSLIVMRDITERKRIEDEEADRISDLMSLSRTAMDLVELSTEEDIYQFIGQRLSELAGNSVIIVSSFDEESSTFCLRAIQGVGEHMDSFLKILGRQPIGITTSLSKEAKVGLTSGRLEKVPGGLYELAAGGLPRSVCNEIETLLGLGDLYAMGFAWKGRLFGSVAVLMRRGAELRNPGIIETFVSQASVALQRWQAEVALRKAHDELEMRVEQRTGDLADAIAKLQLEAAERKQAEEALRKSEELYRLLADNASDIICTLDLDLRFTYVSPAITPQMGYTVAEVEALQLENLLTASSMETSRRTLVEELNQDGQLGVDPSRSRTLDLELLRKDGLTFWVEAKVAFLRDAEGSPMGLIVVARDTTERKRDEEALRKSEEKHRTLLETGATPIYWVDIPGGEITFVNEKAEELFGRTGTDLLGHTLFEFVPENEVALHQEKMQEAARELKIEEQPVPQIIIRPSGELRYTEVYPTMFESEGKIVAQVVCPDVTERKRAEEELRMLTAQSEKMTALAVLASGIAHELNNPMMGMINFVHYCLKHTAADNRIYPVLQGTERETKRCITLVKDLLSFAHAEREEEEEFKKGRLAEVIDRVVKLLSYRIEKENVTLTCHIAEEVPEIEMHENRIQQVLLNVVKNALDAAEETEKKVICIEVSRDGEFVHVEVTDSGCGIAAGNLGKVFDPFFTTKPAGKGTGLGLSVSRSIVVEHEGEITCDSETGVGTTFRVLLPIAGRREAKQ